MSDDRSICLIVNAGSGRVRQDPEAVEGLARALGPRVEVREIRSGKDIEAAARSACDDGFDIVVPVGGDGTIMSVAGVIAGRDVALGVLPMGTFNFFARGLGIPQEPDKAASILRTGKIRTMSIGEVNGRVFLNNASVGVYPRILRAREAVYRRFGRHRIAAYWSVLKTFMRFQRPMRLSLRAEGTSEDLRTPLLFVARSAYQLEEYRLAGAEAVNAGDFAVFAAPDGSRRDLFVQAWRLVRRNMQPGEDFTLRCVKTLTVSTRKPRVLVACDGEKFLMDTPLEFRMRPDALKVIVPPDTE